MHDAWKGKSPQKKLEFDWYYRKMERIATHIIISSYFSGKPVRKTITQRIRLQQWKGRDFESIEINPT